MISRNIYAAFCAFLMAIVCGLGAGNALSNGYGSAGGLGIALAVAFTICGLILSTNHIEDE